MNPLLLDEIVALCKRRVAQGDCPAEAAASVELLEDAVLQLSSYVLALAKAPAHCDSKATSLEPGAPEQNAKKGSGEQAGSTPDETTAIEFYRLNPSAALFDFRQRIHAPAPDETLREALLDIARDIEGLKRECGMDPESPIAIQNGRYMSIAYKVRALATPTK